MRFIFSILISCYVGSVMAQKTCVTAHKDRQELKVGMSVWTNASWPGTIAEVYQDGRVKVNYLLTTELHYPSEVGVGVDCLNGLDVNTPVYTRLANGALHYVGEAYTLVDNGQVLARRSGGKSSHYSLLPIEWVLIPVAKDSETGVEPGEKVLYKDQVAKVKLVFPQGTALVKYDCGIFSCTEEEVPTKDLIRSVGKN